jgi:transposase InsO family protein
MKNHHAYRLAHMKADLIKNILSGSLSVSDAARAVKRSRPTIYSWMDRYKKNGVEGLLPEKTGPKNHRAWNRTEDATEQYILNLIDAHPEENIYDLHDRLPREHSVHPSTLWRIWQRHRVPLRNAKRMERPKPQLYVKEEIGEEIQLDTSFPWGSCKRVCFDCVDDCSRFAYAKLYTNCNQNNAIAFLHHIIAKAPFIIRSIRTDCGREFSRRFTEACNRAGIEHIRNEPYHPEHNGKVEKFHDSLKHKCFYVFLHPKDPLPRQNLHLSQWLIWYNYHKKHSGLGMNRRTPAEVVYQGFSEANPCVKVMLQPNKY